MTKYIKNISILNKKINPDNFNDVEEIRNFIQKNESGTKHFRYFSKRTYDILFHHIYTCLYFYNNECIGYGHLDFENEKIWLGILVSDNFTGLGLGKYILSDLLSQTSEDIFLSVDKDNTTAIRLYTKMGFNILYTTDNYHIMKYKKIQ